MQNNENQEKKETKQPFEGYNKILENAVLVVRNLTEVEMDRNSTIDKVYEFIEACLIEKGQSLALRIMYTAHILSLSFKIYKKEEKEKLVAEARKEDENGTNEA
jgi:hypothetical protein